MRSIYDNHQSIAVKGKTIYFAGANTADGFVGVYKDIANENDLDRLYIIKGGAGTGKSTMMKEIADAAESAGYSVEYYLCGSDPESLDCIVLDGRIAVLDGTAPHTLDMSYPGAASELIDVSKFLDKEILEKNRESIIFHSAEKSAAYASAYRYLRAASAVEREKAALARQLFDREKAGKYVERFVRKLGRIRYRASSEKHRWTRAVTMKGRFKLTTLEESSSMRYNVHDNYAAAPIFMGMLRDELLRAGYSLTTAHIPCENYICGIFIENCGVSVTVGEGTENYQTIKMTRFARSESAYEVKAHLRLAAKCAENCTDETSARLSEAAKHHFTLEEIYKTAMDYDRLGQYKQSVMSEIIYRLGK